MSIFQRLSAFNIYYEKYFINASMSNFWTCLFIDYSAGWVLLQLNMSPFFWMKMIDSFVTLPYTYLCLTFWTCFECKIKNSTEFESCILCCILNIAYYFITLLCVAYYTITHLCPTFWTCLESQIQICTEFESHILQSG